MATTSLQRRVRLGGRLRLGRGLRARSRLRVGPHALAKGMLEGLPYVAILLLLLLLLLVLFLILLFIFFLFLLCASRLSTRQSKVDGTLAACNAASREGARLGAYGSQLGPNLPSVPAEDLVSPNDEPKNGSRPIIPSPKK